MSKFDISAYDPSSREVLARMLASTYETLSIIQDDPEFVKFFAGTTFMVAILGRLYGLNICDLEQSLNPNLDRASQIRKYISGYLDTLILTHLKIASQPEAFSSDDLAASYTYSFRMATLNGALIWKGFLPIQMEQVGSLDEAAKLSLRCLRFLSTIAGKDVLEWVRDFHVHNPPDPKEKEVLAKARAEDWPAPSFLKVYFRHHDQVADSSSAYKSPRAVHSNPFENPPTINETGVMSPGAGLLEIVRPQLFFLKDKYFSGAGDWPRSSFEKFIRIPAVSGYALGIEGASLDERRVKPTESDILKIVMDIHTHFSVNHADVDVCGRFYWQEPMFGFGLDIGAADYSNYMREQTQTGRSQYILLIAFCQLLLTYSDPATLKLNIDIFCKMHGVRVRYDEILDEVVEHWGYARDLMRT